MGPEGNDGSKTCFSRKMGHLLENAGYRGLETRLPKLLNKLLGRLTQCSTSTERESEDGDGNTG